MAKSRKLKQATSSPDSDTKLRSLMFRKRLIDASLITTDWRGRIQHPNGKDLKITLWDVWSLHMRDHLPTVTESTRVNKIFRCSKFLPPLFEIRMCEMTPQIVTELVRLNLETAQLKPSLRRWNFKKELKDLRSLIQWYTDTIDFQYSNPVKQHHYKLAVLREIPRRERQISIEQFQKFLSHLPDFYKKLCTAQFLGACRIGEIAGLQWKNVNFEARTIRIQDVLTWTNGKARVKNCPKNSKTRFYYMSDAMLLILEERLLKRNGCDFVFHKNGQPLLYSVINANCNRAWKKAGLRQFHGTHQARFAAAQQARILTGSIDGVKSLTGQSIQMAQKYSDYSCIDQNKATIEMMETALTAKASG